MLIVGHLGTPNSDFNGCHCMRDPVLYRSMVKTYQVQFSVDGGWWTTVSQVCRDDNNQLL